MELHRDWKRVLTAAKVRYRSPEQLRRLTKRQRGRMQNPCDSTPSATLNLLRVLRGSELADICGSCCEKRGKSRQDPQLRRNQPGMGRLFDALQLFTFASMRSTHARCNASRCCSGFSAVVASHHSRGVKILSRTAAGTTGSLEPTSPARFPKKFTTTNAQLGGCLRKALIRLTPLSAAVWQLASVHAAID